MKSFALGVVMALTFVSAADAGLVRLKIDRREVVLGGKPFGLAGPYEKLIGKAEFALDPTLEPNQIIVDLALAPRNARGEVEFTADFFLLKPVDAARGNGQLFYEVGNRGGKSMLAVFQKATASADPTTEAEFGDGSLMARGFSLLWMGWQWDVPDGRMRMEMPVATDHGSPITGLVRGNFILNTRADTASVADRGHRAYPVIDPASPDHKMTVRDRPTDTPTVIERARWRFVDDSTVSLAGGFEPGRIYDVVYRTRDPKVLGCGLAGARDLVSYLKSDTSDDNPLKGQIRFALAWGVSQSGRYLRHFIYQGFNQDERGKRVFDGVIDQVGGAGRGSFNHRFGQASRDALQHFNIMFPVDMFPFTDGPETDPETGVTDSLLARAERTNTVPKLFHVLTDSEYFNRAGSLVHTDPTGTKDIAPPASSRIYFISSAPHITGAFPPTERNLGDLLGQAAMNPIDVRPVVRALFEAMDKWVVDDVAPPESRYPHLSDGTLVDAETAIWPKIPGVKLPPPRLVAYHLDFGPEWSKGVVTNEPALIGKPFVGRVPSVDESGNDKAGVRLPEVSVPLATHTGWNYRDPSIGAPDRLATEIGSYFPLAKTKADRERTGDSRPSIAERYSSKDDYLGKITAAARRLVDERLLLSQDVPEIVAQASAHFDWATAATAPTAQGR